MNEVNCTAPVPTASGRTLDHRSGCNFRLFRLLLPCPDAASQLSGSASHMLLSQRRCGPTQDQSRCRDTPSGLQQTTVSVQRAVLTPGRLRVSRCSCAGLGQRRPCRGLCVSIRTGRIVWSCSLCACDYRSWNVGLMSVCCLASGTVRCCGAKLTQQAQVVVTREAGRNGKLKQALQDCDIAVLELPLVETKSGPDRWGWSLLGCD